LPDDEPLLLDDERVLTDDERVSPDERVLTDELLLLPVERDVTDERPVVEPLLVAAEEAELLFGEVLLAADDELLRPVVLSYDLFAEEETVVAAVERLLSVELLAAAAADDVLLLPVEVFSLLYDEEDLTLSVALNLLGSLLVSGVARRSLLRDRTTISDELRGASLGVVLKRASCGLLLKLRLGGLP